MRFITAIAITTFPFLVAAAPNPTNNIVKVPLTKRSNLVDKDGVVDKAALQAHVAQAVAKMDRGFANYEMNTGVPHPNAKVLQKRDPGSVTLSGPVNNIGWQGRITIGTPPVVISVIFDTGSTDLFVPGIRCDTNCAGHAVYYPAYSSTSHDLGKSFTMYFHDLSNVIGDQYTDTVQIGGIAATGQTIGAATKYSNAFKASAFSADGVLGLAFQSLSFFPAKSTFETMVTEGAVQEQVFAFRVSDSISELTIGGTNKSLYTGDISYTPVTKQGFWQVSMDVISNGSVLLKQVAAVIDTGTAIVIGDTATVDAFYKSMGGTDASTTYFPGYYTFPCIQTPTISLSFGGRSFPITLNLGFVALGSPLCVGSIIASNTISYWLIGQSFLKTVYVAFDYGKKQVGFATLS